MVGRCNAKYIMATARRMAAIKAHRQALMTANTQRQKVTAQAVKDATHDVLRMEVER